MPDDGEKSVTSSESSPVNQGMGLNDGMWDPSNSAKIAQPLVPPEFNIKNESVNSPKASSISGDMNVGSPSTDSPDAGASSTWMVDRFGTGSRVPFTKREKEFLCCLIQKHVYLKMGRAQSNLPTLGAFNQKNALSTFCRVPNAAWKAIANEYNSKDNVRQRSIKQLRKCWENLKHRGNIDPAALYSGKKLQGITSLSGAFTLTAGGGENDGSQIGKSSESFIDTAMEEENGVAVCENASDFGSQSRNVMPTDLSIRSVGPMEKRSALAEDKSYQPAFVTSSNRLQISESSVSQSPGQSSLSLVSAAPSTSNVPPVPFAGERSRGHGSFITNVRTVRSLKPNWSQKARDAHKDRLGNARHVANSSLLARTNAQRIQDMKVKLLSARIKEHESNAQRVRLQMEHAQAQHDVQMRLLRTKAAWYDAHLRKLEKQLASGDLGIVGEEEDYQRDNPDHLAMQYEQDFEYA